MHIIQVCKTIFSAGFHRAKALSSICLKYRLYTNTQKVYESIPFISLNFSSPHPWPAPLHPTPWGFPAFPVFEDIQGIYEKEICLLKNKKNPSGKGRKYTFVYGTSERRDSEGSPWDTPSV